MAKWRPERWENPHPKSSKEDFGLGDTTVYGWEHDQFEAGADAMLEALRKQGIPGEIYADFLRWGIERGDTPNRNIYKYRGKPGTLVFIPEESK